MVDCKFSLKKEECWKQFKLVYHLTSTLPLVPELLQADSPFWEAALGINGKGSLPWICGLHPSWVFECSEFAHQFPPDPGSPRNTTERWGCLLMVTLRLRL